MNKKGIEPVISTVLLIVITIAIVGVLVGFLWPYIQGLMNKETACRDVKLEIDSSGTCTNESGTQVMVSANFGEVSLSKVDVQITTTGRTKVTSETGTSSRPLPTSGGAETFYYWNQLSANATGVGAIPYVTFKNKPFKCDNGKAELSLVNKC